jgi:tripartite ATP-independent transporter DctM subunit
MNAERPIALQVLAVTRAADAAEPPPRGFAHWFWRLEDALSVVALALASAIPLVEVASRELLGVSLPGGTSAVQYLTLCITFLGAALAARSNKLLALATTTFFAALWNRRARVVVGFLTAAVTSLLLVASVELIRVDFQFGAVAVWGIPVWVVSLVMPVAAAGILGRVIRSASDHLGGRAIAALGLLAPVVLGSVPDSWAGSLAWPLGLALLAGTALGLPIFAALGGAALLFGWIDGTPISAVPGESYRLSTSPLLPAIPLFTLGGYLLSAGGSSGRLLRLFSALAGWIPGGMAIVIVLLLAFFTPLTGASGVTILAMGGLLLPMLVNAGYPARTSIGLITVSGSIGAMLPPSLPVILYAFYAEVPIEQLFVAGLVPGLLLIAAVAAWGGLRGWLSDAKRVPFSARELASAAAGAKWEIAMPVALLAVLLAGYATLVEAAALMVVYALFVECVVFRELSLRRDLPSIVLQSATLVGGFMIILGVALALANYLILAQFPTQLLGWVQQVIRSPQTFLLALNVFLILVGALMDIYSAIIVVVPLLVPMIAAYGLDPLHVGVVFLANMQLGYLMPPMGENLFLSAYRFDKSLPDIYRSTLPYVVILLAVVLLITYWPQLTLWPVRALGY